MIPFSNPKPLMMDDGRRQDKQQEVQINEPKVTFHTRRRKGKTVIENQSLWEESKGKTPSQRQKKSIW